MNSLAARLQAEADDNAGATPAREAAGELAAAARDVRAAAASGDHALLAGALTRLTEATAAAEELLNRQVSASLLLEAGYIQGYAAGQAARGLRAVR
jgi:hypothetical protein